jgi:membrane-associated phospholipid phosphatase
LRPPGSRPGARRSLARAARGSHRAAIWRAVLASVLLAAFVALALSAKAGSSLADWDERVTGAFVAWRSPGWSRAFWVFTLLGESSILAALGGSATVLLATWGRRTHAAMMGGGMLLAIGISEFAKVAVHRARPPEAMLLIKQPGSYSLPSGHALVSIVFCGLLVYLAFRWVDAWCGRGARGGAVAGGGAVTGSGAVAGRAALIKLAVTLVAGVIVVMVSVSRVYLGVHWMSDVLAGWCLGGAWLVVTPALATTVRLAGGSRSPLGDSCALGRRSVRLALAIVLALIVVVAAVLTAWADPLLA